MTTPAEYPAGQSAGTSPSTPAGEGAPQTGLRAKFGPLPAWAWILIIAGGGLAVILYMRSRNSQNAATTAPSAGTSSTASDGTSSDDDCTDSDGNSVPCDQADYASQIAALQAEVSNLQGASSTTAGTTVTGTNATGSTTTTGQTEEAPATTTPAVVVPSTTPTSTQ